MTEPKMKAKIITKKKKIFFIWIYTITKKKKEKKIERKNETHESELELVDNGETTNNIIHSFFFFIFL